MTEPYTSKGYLLPILSGVILSRTMQVLFFPVRIGVFSIDFGHLTILLMVIGSTLLLLERKNVLLWVGVGGSFDQFVYLILKGNPEIQFFSIESIAGSTVFVALSVLVFMRVSHKNPDGNRYRPPIGKFERRKRIVVHGVITILVILSFRLSQILLVKTGISNESRSILFMGYEIHHINSGLILVYIISHILYFLDIKHFKSSILILLSIGIALINDQISYYALENISDAAYLSIESLSGAISISIFQIIVLAMCRDR
jgi:hypothetical protein